MEGMLHILATSNSGTVALPHLRSASFCSIHHNHVRHAIKCNMEWWDGHWAVEEGGG